MILYFSVLQSIQSCFLDYQGHANVFNNGRCHFYSFVPYKTQAYSIRQVNERFFPSHTSSFDSDLRKQLIITAGDFVPAVFSQFF